MEVEEIDLPEIPRGLDTREEDYRETRDRLADLGETIYQQRIEWMEGVSKFEEKSPNELITEYRDQQLEILNKIAGKLFKEMKSLTAKLNSFWDREIKQEAENFVTASDATINSVQDVESLAWGQEAIEADRKELEITIGERLQDVNRALELLSEGENVFAALTFSDEGHLKTTDQLKEIGMVAQSGIAVELIGHELEETANDVEASLKRIPEDCQQSAAYKRVVRGFRGLTDRFRFLSPFSVATYRAREEISGKDISEFVAEFFRHRFKNADVEFQATSAFNSIQIADVPPRIYPVFVNLVINSLYWLKFTKRKKKIVFDFKDGLAIVADSGPGVDQDDLDDLFTMFFTRRNDGRGLGLYLCKTNLAVARHHIRYALPDDPHILLGANFIIEFRNYKSA